MTQNLQRADVRAATPTLQAELLRADPQAAGANASASAEATQYQVWMSNDGGYYRLHWSASLTGSWDWIGLYPNGSVPDGDYIGGDNWQWAVRGDSFKTNTPVGSGHQVRYLVWDGNARQYTDVARGQLR